MVNLCKNCISFWLLSNSYPVVSEVLTLNEMGNGAETTKPKPLEQME